jgi:deoxyribodipyrimidine photo-lyase
MHSGFSVLFLYIFEPSLINDKHYSPRHWNFIKESLQDINNDLIPYNSKVLCVKSEVIPTFNALLSQYKIMAVYSHFETGIKRSFTRDKNFKRYCKNNAIDWVENINNGVFRGRQNRTDWVKDWNDYMNAPLPKYSLQPVLALDKIERTEKYFETVPTASDNLGVFQKGGTHTARLYLNSFKKERYKNYTIFISKPNEARISCSRLSPYFAWGNLSVREVFQELKAFKPQAKNKRAITGFLSRLRWQAHFIQKFEMECTMEEESINKGYHKLKKEVSDTYQDAWETGQTGIPLIDACMRCLKTTGYLNFRMRAMVVSFFVHNLWQPWQAASAHLSQLFLDFEPGIHFPQLQMQAGEVGTNTVRIYNPIKNSLEHDPNAVFIDKWVPELRHLPIAFKHEPFRMTLLEQRLYNLTLGEDYPNPIVDIASTRKKAAQTIWAMKNDEDVITESLRILNKHVIR